MRGFNKFLFKNKWHIYCFFFKKRILSFKRPKWKKIKFRIFFFINSYKKYKKNLLPLQFCRFLKILISLKKEYLKKKQINIKFKSFFNKLNSFLITRYFKKLKRNLCMPNQKLKFFFLKNFKNFFFSYTSSVISHFTIRSRFIFKNLLYMKSTVLKYFNGCFPVKFFKGLPTTNIYKQDVISTFLTAEYRLDILLWRLKFFKSPFLARFAFQQNIILINNNQVNSSYSEKNHYKRCLIGLELVSLKSNFRFSYLKNSKSFVKFLYLPTFLEIDYYSGNSIVLKPLSSLTFKDINSALKEPLCMYKFKNYIFK